MAGKRIRVEQLLVSASTVVRCPKCEHEFSLEEGFAKKALETLEAKSSQALIAVREAERAVAEGKALELAVQRDQASKEEVKNLKQLMMEQAAAHVKALQEVRTLAEQSFKPQLDAMMLQVSESRAQVAQMDQREAELKARERAMGAQIEEGAQRRAVELAAVQRQGLEAALQKSQVQIQALRTQEVTLLREKSELADRTAALELENARKLDVEREGIAAKIRAQEQERAGLEKAELQKTIEDMAGKLAEAQAKANQGSQQLQGEVLELAIEETLRRAFPLDTIEEVKKGARGGDALQRVMTRTGHAAGIILWEMKRAKDWGPQWVAKLKEDMRGSGAVLGILVTVPGALPKDWPSGALFAPYEEVWVTQISTAVGVAEALRAGLIDVHRQRIAAAGKGEKAEALYDYLTSPQFAQKLKAVYEAFTRMREELESEKNVTMQRWARREKQLQLGAQQLLGVAGDIQGLSSQELKMLELENPKADEGAS